MKKLIFLLAASVLSGCATHRISVMEENDAIKIGPGSDANYTQGLSINISSLTAYNPCDSGSEFEGNCKEESIHKKIVNTLNVLQYDDPAENPIYLTYGISQQFYTPDDISIPEIIVDDRPYGGYLFATLGVENVKLNQDASMLGEGDELRGVRLKLGVVGPASFAKDVQTWWHDDVCDCTHPEGWDNQIRNEIGFIYSIRQENRFLPFSFGGNYMWRGDLTTLGELSLGNVYSGIDVGSQIRFGYNIPQSFNNDTIGPANYAASSSKFHAYLYSGVTGRWVARDIFLDGNMFVDSPHTTDKKDFVGEFRIGAAIRYDQWELNVLFAHRTKQFEIQENKHKFGQVMVTYTPN